MPSPFSRTIRSINAESSRLSTIALLVSAAILGGWAFWFIAARVAIYETSEAARLEVDSAAHPIEAAAAGRVIKTSLVIGREVHAGEVLVELESDAQRLQLAEEEARVAAVSAQLAALRGQTLAERQVQTETQAAANTKACWSNGRALVTTTCAPSSRSKRRKAWSDSAWRRGCCSIICRDRERQAACC
jgi:membrane fusion protein (multidrug efflux system)